MVASVHVLSMIPVASIGLAPWLTAVVGASIALHGMWSMWRFGWLRSPQSIVEIELDGQGSCILSRKSGIRLRGVVGAATCIGGRFVILSSRRVGAWAALKPATNTVVTGDMLAGDEFRRLRVMLKWQSGGVPSLRSTMPVIGGRFQRL